MAILDASGATRLAPAASASAATLTFVVPKGSLAPGDYRVQLQNPPSADCVATAAAALAIAPGPRLDGASPPQICASGGTLAVTGAGFADNGTVTLRDPASGASLAAMGVMVNSPASATVQFGGNTFANNTQLDLTWRNVDGCEATLPGAIRVKPGNGNCP